MWALRTEELLAVRYDFEAETNGPHPWQTIAAQHYDLRTGKPVALETLVRDPAALRAMVAEETAQWIAVSGYEAFEDADTDSWTPKQGLLTRDGLLVFFNEGELGPVVAGALVFTIPYERLGDAFTVDTCPASEGNTMQELLEQAAWMYEGGEFWLGDRLTDWVLAEEPKNLEALMTRAEGYCDVDVGDTELVFELLAQIEPLAAGTPRYDRLLAEALYCRAMDKLYVAPEYAGAEPGDEVYDIYSDIFQDLEHAIQLDPTDVNYYNAVNSIAYNMGLFGEESVHEVSDNIREILSYDRDLRGYPDLYAQLNNAGKLDEAAQVLAAWKADESPGTETASNDYCMRADDAYEAGKYEEAILLYYEALETGREAQSQWTPDVPDIAPQRLWYRLADAYMRLERFEEAAGILGEMEEWYVSYFEAGVVFYNQCAEALLALGRTGEAREVLLESLEIWDNEAGEVLLEKIAATLPAAAAEVFAGEEWAGYAPVTTGHFYMYYDWGVWEDWEEISGPLVTVMQKDGHNVLCVLHKSASEGYRLVLANDRAVRQGDELPRIYIDDAWGSIHIEYIAEVGPAGQLTTEGYSFCSRWYWEEEMGEKAEGDWTYMLLDADRTAPEPHEEDYAYYGITRLKMSFAEGMLRLRGRSESYDDAWEDWELLAEMKADSAPYALETFDIEKCSEDFETLMGMSDQESIQYYTGDYDWEGNR